MQLETAIEAAKRRKQIFSHIQKISKEYEMQC